LFGAVLHSFAVSGRPEEAHELFRSMDSDEDGFEVKPGISCFNAILLTHVKAHSWDEVISVCETMQEKEITANPQTIQGLALAYYRKEGRVGAMSFLEKLSVSKATVDETTFKLAVRLLLPEIDASTSIDDIRKQIRELGESDPQLRDAAISLIRSVRVAHIEQNRPGGEKHPVERAQSRQDEAWKSVLRHLLKFLRSSDTV
jgi:pentatricopeptide repeat protein